MKTLRHFFLILLGIALMTCCRDDNPIPEPQDLYLFPFKSEVDAKSIGCGYESYEEVGDWIKKKLREKVPNLTTQQLIELGDYFHQNHIQYPIVRHKRSDWAEEIVERMKPHLVEKAFPYNVYTVEAPVFNAFTIPGGNIYVTTGLLDAVNSQDELSYIMGHELGHNENDHTRELARLYKYAEAQQKAGDLLSVGTALITRFASAICGKPDELECDISSMYLLYQAGYDPEKALGGIDLLRRFSTPRPADDWKATLFSFFSTHPWSEDRANCVKAYVRNAKVRVECAEVYPDRQGVVATKKSPLNAREYPSTNAAVLGKIPKGATVKVICDCVPQPRKSKQDWLYVLYRDDVKEYRGWVDKQYIKTTN